MPVLLLCYGDKEAKDLLRSAIEARYGASPPVIENLSVEFKGRARAKVGPITTWVPVDAVARFRFPTHIRWDFVVKPMGVSVQRGIEAYDGEVYRSLKQGLISDPERVNSIRRRLWAIAAMFLTPLSEHTIKLTANGERCFDAENTTLNDSVTLCVRDDNTLEKAQVLALNPDTNTEQKYIMQLSQEQVPVDGLMMPKKIHAFWDDTASFEIEPIKVEVNPELSIDLFTLEGETA